MHAGRVEPGFELVEEAFAEVVKAQSGTGAAMAVWLEGRWLVDLWGGTADALGTRAWERDSIVQPYSVTKPFAAVCALRLVERGELELDTAVQRYWPEFTAPATVRQVLAHQAGVVALDEPASTELFYDWEGMCRRLAAQTPAWEPGTAHGESALFYGHLVGELVRRVDGRSVGCFLREEVCGPLGLDFAIGLGPVDQTRAIELTGLDDQFRAPVPGEPELYQRAISNPPGAHDAAVVNSERWRAAEIPAINGHGSARGVAGLYAALVEGRVLTARVLTDAIAVQTSGIDRVFGEANAFGLGFGVDENGFGMGGLGGSYGGASRDGYAIAFLTGSMGNFDRATSVENALRSCLGLKALL